jgi:predicted amidophosphoribosyltransferase
VIEMTEERICEKCGKLIRSITHVEVLDFIFCNKCGDELLDWFNAWKNNWETKEGLK